jgi:hypothetical protein
MRRLTQVQALTRLSAGANDSLSNLDHSATLRTFGIILANLQEDTARACAALGNAFSRAYAGAVLPDGAPGDLVFTSNTSAEYGQHP